MQPTTSKYPVKLGDQLVYPGGLECGVEIGGRIRDVHSRGLTKREYFAAAALQGLLSNRPFEFTHDVAAIAVNYADGLIHILEKRKEMETLE